MQQTLFGAGQPACRGLSETRTGTDNTSVCGIQILNRSALDGYIRQTMTSASKLMSKATIVSSDVRERNVAHITPERLI